MDKYSLDYEKLEQKFSGKKAFRLKDVEDKIEKVAFDVVRFKDSDDAAKLWVVQPHEDGDVIVAMYDDESEQLKTSNASQNNWSIVPDNSSTNVNVFYKGEPVKKIVFSSLGVPKEDFTLVCRTLSDKLTNDNKFKKSMLNSLPNEEKKALLEKYPELKG